MLRSPVRRVLKTLSTCLIIACEVSISCSQVTQSLKTPSIIIRRPDSAYNKSPDAMVKDDAFQVQVNAPGAGHSITVTFSTASGTTRTLDIPETSPGSGSYLSQPITVAGGAQKTGKGSLLPGNLSRAMNGLSPTDGDQVTISTLGQTTGFRVYDTDFTMVVAENNRYFAARQNQLKDAVVTARTLLKHPHVSPATTKSLNNSLRIAKGKLRLIEEMQNLLANPPARTGAGDYSGTVWWQAGVQHRYYTLLSAPDPDDIPASLQLQASQQQSRITQQGHDAADNLLIKTLAAGLYLGVTNAMMVAPVYTTVTGKNVFGQQATPEEIAGAAISLATFVATYKVIPAVADTTAGAAANELSGLGPRVGTAPLPAPVGGIKEAPGNTPTEMPVDRGAKTEIAIHENAGRASNPSQPVAQPLAPSNPAPTINGVSARGLDNATVRALEYLNEHRVPQEELEGVAATARMAERPAYVQEMRMMGARARQFIANIDGINALQASARAAGVPDDAIAAAINRAEMAVADRQDALEAFGYHLDFELRALRTMAKGDSILVRPEDMAAFRNIAGDAVTARVQQANPYLYRISTKLTIMERGEPVIWSKEEIQALREVRQMPNRANLYLYFNDEGSQLVRVFDEKALATADRFYWARNSVAISQGRATLPPLTNEGGLSSVNSPESRAGSGVTDMPNNSEQPGTKQAGDGPADRPNQGTSNNTPQGSENQPKVSVGALVSPDSGGKGPEKPLGGTDLGGPGHGPTMPLGGTADLPKSEKPFDGYTAMDTSLEKPEASDSSQAVKDAAEKKVSTSSHWSMKTDDSGTTTFTSPDGQTIVTVVKLASGYLVTHYERTNAKRIADLMNNPLGKERELGEKAKKLTNEPLGEDSPAPKKANGKGSGAGSNAETSNEHSSDDKSSTESGGATRDETPNAPAQQNQVGESQTKEKSALAAPAGAQTLEPNTARHTTLAVQNRCSKPQTFTVETDGFPNSFLQTSGPESIEAGKEHNFTLKLDTHGLAPGVYRGHFIITCTSCGDTCEQSKRVVAYQFFIPEDAAAGEGPGANERRVILNGVVAGYVRANPDPLDKLEHPYIFRPWMPAMQFAYIQPTSVDVRPDGTVVQKGGDQKTLGTVQK